MNRMAVNTLPFRRQHARHARQKMRSQVPNAHPGQHQKSRVVGQQVDVLAPRLIRPTKEAISTAQIMRRRGPGKTGDRPRPRIDHKFQVLSNRLLVPKIVILLEQTVEQRLFRCAPHRAELERADLSQSPPEWTSVHLQRRRLSALGQGVGRSLPNRR